jgi:hypothetical protein
LRAQLITPSFSKVWGEYLFTLDWAWENKGILDTNFSETSEHKCAHLFKADSGHFYAYPNNRIIWHDKAWSDEPITCNPGYKIDTNIYSVENTKVSYTDDHYMTNFTSTPSA